MTAKEDLNRLEYEIFAALRAEVGTQAQEIRSISKAVAAIDVLCSLAELAVYQGYCCPQIQEGKEIKILDGRHPVVEKSLPAVYLCLILPQWDKN